MNLIRLAMRSITGNSFRSWVVGLCAMLVVSLALATTLVIRPLIFVNYTSHSCKLAGIGGSLLHNS